MMVYFTSDLHFFHDRKFIWGIRGFSSVEEMNDTYVKEWNSKVGDKDDIYVLGDFCLGQDFGAIKDLLGCLKGKIHLIIGNHDTDEKIKFYKESGRFEEIVFATIKKFGKKTYYLSHYPTLTSNLEADPKKCVFNLYGHIHTNEQFYEGKPFMRNVSVDANSNKILLLDEIEDSIKNEINKCLEYL